MSAHHTDTPTTRRHSFPGTQDHSLAGAPADATITWTPEHGSTVDVSFTGATAATYEKFQQWISRTFYEAQELDVTKQREHVNLPARGLTPLTEAGLSFLWRRTDTPLTFGTPVLAEVRGKRNDRLCLSYHIQLHAIPNVAFPAVDWDNEDDLQGLITRMGNADALLIEATLTDAETINEARRLFDAKEAVTEIGETLTRADHVPYTRVARILKEAGTAGSMRVFPLNVPGSDHVPVVAVTYRSWNSQTQDSYWDALRNDGLTRIDVPEDTQNRSYRKVTFWVKNSTLIDTRDAAIMNWLTDKATDLSSYWSGGNYKYAPA